MTKTIEDYLARVARSLDRAPPERDEIIRELRSHLWDKLEAQRSANPEKDEAVLQWELIASLDDPTTLALAYGKDGRLELQDAAGATVYRFSDALRRTREVVGKEAAAAGRATGRLVRTSLVVTLIAVALILTSLTVIAITRFDDINEVIRAGETERLHRSSDVCDPDACTTTTRLTRSFHVHAEARELRFFIDVSTATNGNGTLHVRVLDPSGAVQFERSYASGQTGRHIEETSWRATGGTWRIETTQDDFGGRSTVLVSVRGTAR